MAGFCFNNVKCFARKKSTKVKDCYTCSILTEPINSHPCPFAKAEREVTNGVQYPYNPVYDLNGKRKKDV